MRALWFTVVVVAACSAEPPAPVVAARQASSIPSFRHDVAPVLEQHCTARGCHGDEPDESVALDLRASSAYRELVMIPSELGSRQLRVAPGAPLASVLVRKLTGELGGREGNLMPLDNMTGDTVMPSPLPARFVDEVLVRWIAAGAPDN